MLFAVELVQWFPPFNHYRVADFLRVINAAGALVACMPVVLVAYRRWLEGRRSACLFLTAIAVCLVGDVAAGSIISLGRPPVWPVVLGRFLFVAVTLAACAAIPGEARRGVWARRS